MNKLRIYLGENKIDTIEINYKIDISERIMELENGIYSLIIYYTNNKNKKEKEKEYRLVKKNNIYNLYKAKDKNKRYWNEVLNEILREFKICCDINIIIEPIYGYLYSININNLDKIIERRKINIIDCCGIDVRKEVDKELKKYRYNITSININEDLIEDKNKTINDIDVDIDNVIKINIINRLIRYFRK
jgi:hypothetical protein